MKRLFTVFGLAGLCAMAMALSAFNKVFHDKYGIKDDSTLGKASCAACHMKATGGKLNPYGKDIQSAMKAERATKLSAAILGKVEGLDSDKDGKKNIDEIKADTMPGG